MKSCFVVILLGIVSLLGTSCEPQEVNQEPTQLSPYQSTYTVPTQLQGEYTKHTGTPKTGKEEVEITITPNHVSVKGLYDLDLNSYTIFVNSDCWLIIYLSGSFEIRISDYIKELNLIVVTLWENGVQTAELGVFDKTTVQ